ncbi:MAG: aldehyde dehydrogenase [Bdellovibrionaceae bacterium]|nr:aldehyde dehydrogenase [Pseudobdellovibrionaceae bacterium]
MQQIKNFINGEFVAPQNGRYLDNFNPATGLVYSQLADSEAIDVVMAFKAAHKAFESWSKTPVQERANILLKIADIIERRRQEFAEAESLDMGKPLWLASEVDMPRAILNFRFFANRILQFQEKSSDMDGQAINYSRHEPIGVTGLIAPWNLPLYLMTWKIAPSLAVGNTAVCKPSELSPMTASMLGEVFNEAGLPPGVCNIVQGRGETVGDSIVTHPGIPLISFTGGTDTGAIILQKAGKMFKKMGMELGGKNANIIFKDAELDKCIETTLRSSFLNSGQVCLCGSRIFVQQEIYNEFMDRFVQATKNIKVGDPRDKNNFMGPVVSKEQKEKVLAAIAQAKQEGGKILAGEESLELPEANQQGYFVRPTIIDDLTDCSDLWQKEIFGPVVTVRPFKYKHDAIKWANNTSFGLSASVWTRDLKTAHSVAQELKVGTVWVNAWSKRDLRVNFGGYKESGLGREGGDDSINFYTEQKNICISY